MEPVVFQRDVQIETDEGVLEVQPADGLDSMETVIHSITVNE
jgi:hypothetical protein